MDYSDTQDKIEELQTREKYISENSEYTQKVMEELQILLQDLTPEQEAVLNNLFFEERILLFYEMFLSDIRP